MFAQDFIWEFRHHKLVYIRTVFPFYTPWNHQITRVFLLFFRGYRKAALVWYGFNCDGISMILCSATPLCKLWGALFFHSKTLGNLPDSMGSSLETQQKAAYMKNKGVRLLHATHQVDVWRHAIIISFRTP